MRTKCSGHCGCPNCRNAKSIRDADVYTAMAASAQVQSDETEWRKRGPLILELVAGRHGVSMEKLMSGNRTQPVAACRQQAAYLLRRLTGYSFPAIGEILGRDHSTIIHAYNLVAKQMLKYPERGREIEKLVQLIENQPPVEKQVAA